MDELFYNGNIYTRRRNGRWTLRNEVVPETMQRTLQREWERIQKYEEWPLEVLWEEGGRAQNAGDWHGAIRYYEEALKREPARNEIHYMLASLSSCYRKVKEPEKCIALLEHYDGRNTEFDMPYISAPFLTSVSAAYMDLGNVEKARETANRARMLSAGHPAPELLNLLRSIINAEG